jgi:hypothetical protein
MVQQGDKAGMGWSLMIRMNPVVKARSHTGQRREQQEHDQHTGASGFRQRPKRAAGQGGVHARDYNHGRK